MFNLTKHLVSESVRYYERGDLPNARLAYAGAKRSYKGIGMHGPFYYAAHMILRSSKRRFMEEVMWKS